MFRKEIFPHNYILVELDVAARIGYFYAIMSLNANVTDSRNNAFSD
jgi:hypothetical protein